MALSREPGEKAEGGGRNGGRFELVRGWVSFISRNMLSLWGYVISTLQDNNFMLDFLNLLGDKNYLYPSVTLMN